MLLIYLGRQPEIVEICPKKQIRKRIFNIHMVCYTLKLQYYETDNLQQDNFLDQKL
jgi:hypothetical protein